MKIILFGANGTIGSECLRQALSDNTIEHVTSITRRPLDSALISDKHTNIIHSDFLDYTPLSNLFQTHQACIWALGISQNAVNEAEYIKITHDYTLAVAKAIANVNPDMRFIFISGMGADSTEQSRFLFGRIKGKTENDLVKESGLKETYTIRPGAVLSSKQSSNKPWYERAFVPVLHIFKVIKPAWVISSIGLARAILFLVKNGHHATLFENQDIRDIIHENHLVE